MGEIEGRVKVRQKKGWEREARWERKLRWEKKGNKSEREEMLGGWDIRIACEWKSKKVMGRWERLGGLIGGKGRGEREERLSTRK